MRHAVLGHLQQGGEPSPGRESKKSYPLAYSFSENNKQVTAFVQPKWHPMLSSTSTDCLPRKGRASCLGKSEGRPRAPAWRTFRGYRTLSIDGRRTNGGFLCDTSSMNSPSRGSQEGHKENICFALCPFKHHLFQPPQNRASKFFFTTDKGRAGMKRSLRGCWLQYDRQRRRALLRLLEFFS